MNILMISVLSLSGFGGFWEASWEGKSSQDRSKIDSKRHQKNDEEKSASWSPQGGGEPTGAPRRGGDPGTP